MPRNLREIKVPSFRRGMKYLPLSQMNALVDGVNRSLVGVSTPLQPSVSKGGASAILRLTLIAHFDDYLECQDAALNTIYVAKPYELRRTPFDTLTIDGVTYTYVSESERNAVGGFDEEAQFITPSYRDGGEIYAVKVKGGTGIETAEPAPIDYIEINQGRAWAYDPAE